MTATYKYDTSANYMLEYPVFEGEGVFLMNFFTEKLISEIKNVCRDDNFIGAGFKYRLSYDIYGMKEESEKCTIAFTADLRKRGRTLSRKKLEAVWADGLMETFKASDVF